MARARKARTNGEPTFDEIRSCLNRSGYLMESRLVRKLTDAGYFVEPNQPMVDPRTGKSREIDLIATYDATHNVPTDHMMELISRTEFVETTFVVEAVNNSYPFVLLTSRPETLGHSYEDYVKYCATPDPCPYFESLLLALDRRCPDRRNLFSQYCAITTKRGKEEFMAVHPEDTYNSLLKLSEYSENSIGAQRSVRENKDSAPWRVSFWQPILVVRDQLVVVTVETDGAVTLQEVKYGFLEFNWHAGDKRTATVIDIVTEGAFLERVEQIRESDAVFESELNKFRVGQ